MKHLSYRVSINAPKAKVWEMMLGPTTYKKWVKAFSPNSQYDGEWVQGTIITFIDPNMGGTKAILETIVPHEKIYARHVTMINKDGSEDSESDVAKKWIGTTEEYLLNETSGVTELSIEIRTHSDFVGMFSDSWPKALDLLKGMCEASE